MKKLLIAAAMLIASTGIFAQAQPKKDAKDSKMTAVKKDTAKKATAKVVPMAKPAGPTKKDGSADMRYKANKEAAKPAPAGPVKKDGSADMRYKANKASKDSTKKKN
jgi:hypothetical protein